MFCPKCKAEYREGFDTCSDCGIPLVEKLPQEPDKKPEYIELVTILETNDQALLLIAKSILTGAGIDYYAKGEGLQDLFGWGRIGAFNPIVGGVQIQVRKQDEKVAKSLLEELN